MISLYPTSDEVMTFVTNLSNISEAFYMTVHNMKTVSDKIYTFLFNGYGSNKVYIKQSNNDFPAFTYKNETMLRVILSHQWSINPYTFDNFIIILKPKSSKLV